MKTSKYIMLLLLVCTAATIQVHAQSKANPMSDTLRWNATSFTDQAANVNVQSACQFVTYGTNQINWVQKNGAIVYLLSVTKVEGTWTDATSDGSITYYVTMKNLTGTLTITRSGTLSLALVLTGTIDSINNLYTISTFDIL